MSSRIIAKVLLKFIFTLQFCYAIDFGHVLLVCPSFLHVGLRWNLRPTEFSVVELLPIPTNGSLRAFFYFFGHVISTEISREEGV